MLNKRCPRCEYEYVAPDEPPEDHFYRNAANADGLSGWCKDCRRVSAQAENLFTKESLFIKKGLLSSAVADHECRYYSFYYDNDTKVYRCPLCHTSYAATFPLGPPPERPKKRLTLAPHMEIWKGKRPKKPPTSCMIVDGEVVSVWWPEIKT